MPRTSTKSPAYVVRQDHSYCFRMVIPTATRPVLGRTELRYTLHTGSLAEAKFRARTIAAYVQGLIKQAAGGFPKVQHHTPAQLQGLVRDFVADCLQTWEPHIRAKPHQMPSSTPWEVMSRGGALPNPTLPAMPSQAPQAPMKYLPTVTHTPLRSIIADYTSEKMNARKWTDKTRQENLACYDLFLDFAGQDIVVEDITAKLVREYKAALQRLPTNQGKIPAYRGRSAHEVLQMATTSPVAKPLSIGTVNKYLNRLSTLLAYAVQNGFITINPASGMQLEQPKQDDEFRGTFTPDDLYALFHSAQYVGDTFKHPYQFWTPLLALFTGARQNEVAQLYLGDLHQEEGVWVFDINRKLDKKLKTKNSARLIPIHPFLLNLGLVNYAQELQDKGEVRLFPELPLMRDGYGQEVSRWFNGNGNYPGLRRKCGIIPAPGEPKKDFHSFRHTFIDHLVQKRVDLTLLHRLNGHKFGSMTMDRYSKGKTLVRAISEEVVSRVDFHQTIPLDHLKASRFARAEGHNGWCPW